MRSKLFLGINGQKNVVAGLIYLVFGITIFFWSLKWTQGTATRMGPGYFPHLVGIVLCLFGIAAIAQGVLTRKPDPLPAMKLEPLLLILASVLAFGLLIERAGMIVATLACVFLACLRRALVKPLEVFIIFAALAAFNYFVFYRAFGMNMRIYPWGP
jgi:hypothetical protein